VPRYIAPLRMGGFSANICPDHSGPSADRFAGSTSDRADRRRSGGVPEVSARIRGQQTASRVLLMPKTIDIGFMAADARIPQKGLDPGTDSLCSPDRIFDVGVVAEWPLAAEGFECAFRLVP
jgi:hypothetical protein